jgi:PIN domain nuclease of toxin-antitoxin system
LVDSHVLLWFVEGNRKRISPAMRERIEAVGAMVSVASLWEIAIKSGLGKLQAPDDLPERVEQLGFELLAVTPEHAWRVRSLPSHHRDPFDRLPIVTADAAVDAYDVDVIWD